ncbi:solid-state culture-specific ATP-grasp domain protein [Aspergillus avenaceus]|uniref:Solid-state culture-specific ATP-grasp domain protein n=1 Tax=Aspergillus avenaceus TaxID=36643 RepID=A0A5N6TXC5_ASPAV|nr:solid-state culture-specific ATP-grasp domain protein [Aspergillus avenaceus]
MAPQFPPVELDRTLHDLYAEDNGDPNNVAHVIALAPPFQCAAPLPPNKKYIYQTPMAPRLDGDVYARICLGNGAQNHGFMSGPIPLYLFDIDPPQYDVANLQIESPPAARTDAHRVYNCLVPWQRPKLRFISDPQTFKPSAPVSPYPPLDFLDKHACIVSQEAHYGLLSKRNLALSGLPAAPGTVIEGSLAPEEVQDEEKVARETQRMLDVVRARPTPFVLKFPQSLSGQGVFVMSDEESKASRMPFLEGEVARMIRTLTPENAVLSPVSLVIQAFIPGNYTRNLSLFITHAGRPIFISCAEQFLDDEGIYRGSILDYHAQEELEGQYKDTIEKVAAHVHKQGFYGPMGADVMTDPSTGTQYIVDLNVRITGDYMMGPLRGHFLERRGLAVSYLITPLVVLGDRDAFEERFESEMMEGRMIVIGWVRGKGGRSGKHVYSVASVVIGGRDREHALELVGRVNALALAKPQ